MGAKKSNLQDFLQVLPLAACRAHSKAVSPVQTCKKSCRFHPYRSITPMSKLIRQALDQAFEQYAAECSRRDALLARVVTSREIGPRPTMRAHRVPALPWLPVATVFDEKGYPVPVYQRKCRHLRHA
jgi:hypothetical protein